MLLFQQLLSHAVIYSVPSFISIVFVLNNTTNFILRIFYFIIQINATYNVFKQQYITFIIFIMLKIFIHFLIAANGFNVQVLGRVGAQLKQLKKGLKDTGVWPLISFRPDVLPLLFPRESEVEITPEVNCQNVQEYIYIYIYIYVCMYMGHSTDGTHF